jgi:hypothetical protein
MTLFLDMDGVLADFDTKAGQVLETDNHYKLDWVWGSGEYWKRINERAPDFFQSMAPMPDMKLLMAVVTRFNPWVLTALPKTNGAEVEKQKRWWLNNYLGHGIPMIACETKEKPNYCQPGDVIVDDRAVNKAAWEAKGGIYILHTSAADSIIQMADKGIL